jgi:WD40 repeat protein
MVMMGSTSKVTSLVSAAFRSSGWLRCLLVAVFCVGGIARAEEKPAETGIVPVEAKLGRPVDFEKDVFPILDAKCVACHNVAIAENGLILEDVKSILKGGKRGPSVVSKDPEKSVLYTMSARTFLPAMPPLPNKVEATAMTPEELGILKQWILEGASEGMGSGGKTIVWQPIPKGVHPIYATAISGDGQYVACGRANGIAIYHVPSGDLVAQLTDPNLLSIQHNGKPMYGPGSAHRDFVHSLAMTPNGKMLASGGYREVKLWVQPDVSAKLNLAGSPGAVNVVATSADDKWAATASTDNVVRVWNLADGSVAKTLAGHAGTVTGLAFTADSAKLVSASADQSVRVWDVASGAQVARVDTPAPITSLAVAIDGTKLFTGHADKMIRIWTTPVALAALVEPQAAAPALAASPDRKLLAIPEADGKVTLVDVATGAAVKQLVGHAGAVTSVKFSQNGARLVSGGVDRTIRVWDVASGMLVQTLVGGTAELTRVAIHPAGNNVAAGYADGQVSLFKLDVAAARAFPSDNGAAVTVSTLSRDGKLSATDGVEGGKPAIIVRDVASGNVTKKIVAFDGAITALGFNADGTLIAAGSADKTARVFNIAEAKELAKFVGHTNTVTAIAFTNDNNVVASGAADNTAKVWNVSESKELANIAGFTGPVTVGAIQPGNNQVAFGSADGTVRVFNPGDGAQAVGLTPGQAVSGLAVSADGQKIAVSGTDNVTRVYKPDGNVLWTLTGPGGAVKQVAMSADATRLVTRTAENLLVVWDLATGQLVEARKVDAGANRVEFAGANNLLLVASADQVQAVHTLNYERGLVHPAMAIRGLVYANGGEAVFTACEDGHVRRFNPADGAQQFAANHGAKLFDLAISADGQWLATAGENNQTKVWNAGNGGGHQFHVLAGIPAAVKSVAFSGDGEFVASGTVANLVTVHSLKTGQPVQQFAEQTGSIDALAAAGVDPKSFVAAAADKSVKSLSVVAGLVIAGSNAPITGLAINPATPTHLWAASEDGLIRGIDINNGQAFRSMNHGGPIAGLAIRPDGLRVATAGANAIAKLWDAANGQQVAELKGDVRTTRVVQKLTADDGQAKAALAVATAAVPAAEKVLTDRTEALKKATEAKTKAETAATEATTKLTAATEAAAAAKKAADEKKDDAALAKAAADTEKARVDADAAAKKANEDKQRAVDAEGQAQKDVNQATEAVAKAKTDLEGATNISKGIDAALVAAKQAETDRVKPVRSIAFSRDGKEVAYGCEAGYFGLCDGTTGVPLDATDAHSGSVAGLAYTSGKLLTSVGSDGAAKVWTVHPEWQLAAVLGPKPDAPLEVQDSVFIDRVLSLAINPAGTLLATGGGDPSRSGELILWDLATKQPAKTIADAHSDTIFGMEFSRDGRFLLTGAADKFVKIFDVEAGKQIKSFEGHTNHVLDVAWRADGQRIVSAGADNAIKVWNVELGEQERTIAGYAKQVTSIQYVGRANQVISCGGDKTVRFHTADNGGNFRNFAGATDFLYAVSASENEQFIVAGGQDGVLRVWNAANAQVVRTFEPAKELPANVQAAK